MIKKYGLPEYPCKKDVWDALKEEERPIMVYGMGNGADKLFLRFAEYGIEVREIFASDGFVRGHSFKGYKVKSFSEIKEKYSDFVIVLSFASNRREVVQMLSDIDAAYDMYIPDMPICDMTEYFDKDFYNKHYDNILKVYNSLSDEESKRIYSSVLHFRLSGRLSYLLDGYSEKDEMYSLIGKDKVFDMIDAGAYNGDTAKEAELYFENIRKIYAIEPDSRSFKKLSLYAGVSKAEIYPINAAVWSYSAVGEFSESGNRNSTVSATASFEHKKEQKDLISIDSLNIDSVDYIKYDVEGAELEALIGSERTIRELKPRLLVSLYHRSRDVFSLPIYLFEAYPEYDFYIRRLYSVPAWELNLIMVPKNA